MCVCALRLNGCNVSFIEIKSNMPIVLHYFHVYPLNQMGILFFFIIEKTRGTDILDGSTLQESRARLTDKL